MMVSGPTYGNTITMINIGKWYYGFSGERIVCNWSILEHNLNPYHRLLPFHIKTDDIIG